MGIVVVVLKAIQSLADFPGGVFWDTDAVLYRIGRKITAGTGTVVPGAALIRRACCISGSVELRAETTLVAGAIPDAVTMTHTLCYIASVRAVKHRTIKIRPGTAG